MTHPAVDAVTAKAMVVLQDRTVVSFAQWLADGLRECSDTGRGLQIVTSSRARLTVPLKLVLAAPNSHWVVRDETSGSYYDGLSGAAMQWDGAAFVPVPGVNEHAPAYLARPPAPVGAQLTLTFRVRYAEGSPLGGATEQLCMLLTGEPPSGWGTAEPATVRWRREELTQLYRKRSPRATWLTVVGGGRRPAIGTMLLSRAKAGAEEAVTLVVGYDRPDEAPVTSLPTFLGVLAADFTMVSLFAQLSPGRSDLTTEPYWVGPPAPIGMAVGGEMADLASNPPGIQGQRIGDMRSPTVWYALGDGWSQDGWQRYEQLTRHLRSRLSG